MEEKKDKIDKKSEEAAEKDGICYEPLGETIPGKEPEVSKEAEVSKETEVRAETEASRETAAERLVDKPTKSGKKKFIAIIPAVIVLVLLGIYIGIAVHYRTHFLPNTSINGMDCSDLDAAQVAGLLEHQLQAYLLEILGRDYRTTESGAVLGIITASDISLTYAESSRISVEQLLEQQNIYSWPIRMLGHHSYGTSLVMGVSYDETLLSQQLTGWEACQKKNMIAPEDAYISEYSEQLKGYEIIPETIGTRFDVEQLRDLVHAAIITQETTLDIEAAGCYEEAAVTRQDAKLAAAVGEANKMLGAQVTYDWNGTEVILDAELLKEWVSIEGNKAVLDEDAVKAFVKEQAESYDTYGKPRNFVTTLGVELTLPSGYYGWLTDKEAETEELLKLIYAGSVEKREPVYGSTARKKGMSDIGSSYVEADLTHQHLYLYQDGNIVFETDFVSGSMSSTPDCVTPQGVFGLTYKTTNAVLRGANYETPVNYWMPFYGNFGMHDATWRSVFGGDIYITGGSHGCINLPLEAAATIYEYVSTGFPVICYYYPVDPLAEQTVSTGDENFDESEGSEEPEGSDDSEDSEE